MRREWRLVVRHKAHGDLEDGRAANEDDARELLALAKKEHQGRAGVTAVVLQARDVTDWRDTQ